MAGIDINDERLVNIKNEGIAKEEEIGDTYDDIVSKTDDYYNRIDQSLQDYGETQKQLQEQRTDFTIDTIEQQKAQAEADYLKEQKGAYADWQKESNRYGANAEAMAANGLAASGYSESSQVAMFNAYQNRVATARESYNRAVLNYDNAIKDAQLQGSSALAELAFNTLQTQLQNQLQGFQYKNQLLLEKANQKLAINQTYYNRYIDQVNQINTENALAEQVRQANLDEKYRRDALAEDARQFNAAMAQSASGSYGGSYDLPYVFGQTQNQPITTEYYSGNINPDTQYGYFENNPHQPNNINGQPLSKTGKTQVVTSTKLYGPAAGTTGTTKQQIWQTADGKQWIWDGLANQYKPYNAANYISTDYYKGEKNPDAANGTLKNGYQPDNVGGSKLTSTKEKISIPTVILYGDKAGTSTTVKQTVWRDTNGNRWIWDGINNRYVPYSD